MRESGDAVRCKKKCCKSSKRCKRCPVVWKRLSKHGYAERTGKVEYVLIDVVPKRTMKAVRRRTPLS
jgi:hypothetical protein